MLILSFGPLVPSPCGAIPNQQMQDSGLVLELRAPTPGQTMAGQAWPDLAWSDLAWPVLAWPNQRIQDSSAYFELRAPCP